MNSTVGSMNLNEDNLDYQGTGGCGSSWQIELQLLLQASFTKVMGPRHGPMDLEEGWSSKNRGRGDQEMPVGPIIVLMLVYSEIGRAHV